MHENGLVLKRKKTSGMAAGKIKIKSDGEEPAKMRHSVTQVN